MKTVLPREHAVEDIFSKILASPEASRRLREVFYQYLDEIERIHGLYSPAALGLAAAIACCGFTFLLGGGPVEMFCAFIGAGLGNFLRCKLTKHHFTLLKNKVGYPRISVTVPSIVIMVPGLYLYRGFYNLGIMSLSLSASWFAAALLIIAALPLGLIFARILTDKAFRYCT